MNKFLIQFEFIASFYEMYSGLWFGFEKKSRCGARNNYKFSEFDQIVINLLEKDFRRKVKRFAYV